MLNSLGSTGSMAWRSPELVAPKFSRCLATIEANLLSPANSENKMMNSGAVTYDRRNEIRSIYNLIEIAYT
jgi:hypothetical protein